MNDVQILGAIFAFTGIILYVIQHVIRKQEHGGDENRIEGWNFKVQLSNSALVIFAAGFALIVIPLVTGPSRPPSTDSNVSEAGRNSGSGNFNGGNANGGSPSPLTNQSPASHDNGDAVRLEITPPAGNVIRKDDPLSDVRLEDSSWGFSIRGTAEGSTGGPPLKVYLLYREIGNPPHSWYVQNGGEVAANGEWTARGWVDDKLFNSKKQWTFEMMAVASSEELARSSRIDHLLGKIRPPDSDRRSDEQNPGKAFQPMVKAMTKSYRLTMLNPKG